MNALPHLVFQRPCHQEPRPARHLWRRFRGRGPLQPVERAQRTRRSCSRPRWPAQSR